MPDRLPRRKLYALYKADPNAQTMSAAGISPAKLLLAM
jgi:hypothetical protein